MGDSSVGRHSGLDNWPGHIISLSLNLWGAIRPLGIFSFFANKTIFDVVDFFVANIFLPLNAFLIAVFAGWMMSRQSTLEELGLPNGGLYKYWRIILRFVAPVAFALIFYSSLK